MDVVDKHRQMIELAMNEPENLVLVIQYFDPHKRRITQRTVSPIRWSGPWQFQAQCLARQQLRTFKLGRVRNVRFKHAADVEIPEKILIC